MLPGLTKSSQPRNRGRAPAVSVLAKPITAFVRIPLWSTEEEKGEEVRRTRRRRRRRRARGCSALVRRRQQDCLDGRTLVRAGDSEAGRQGRRRARPVQ